MKRKLALLTALCLLIALLPACRKERKPTPTLRIVTNVGFQDEQFGGEDDLKSVIEYFGGLPEGTAIELEVLPTEGAELHTRLTRLRTELLSGGGPDVFLMCDPPMPDRDLLFRIPETAMEKYFLPLDGLKDSAQHMDWEAMDQTVLAAGQTEDGQMLLPLFYGCAMARTDRELGAVPGSWDEAVQSEDKAVRECYGAMLYKGALGDLALGDVADYESETLLITEEELNRRVKEGLAFEYDRETSHVEWKWEPTYLGTDDRDGQKKDSVLLLRNTEGGVTARVNTYIAVNRNTTHKEDALALVDMMASREFLSVEPFWSERRMMETVSMFLFTEMRDWNGGVPIYDDYFEEGRTMNFEYSLPEYREAVYREMLDGVSRAYIPSAIDQELVKLFNECRQASGEAEVDKLVANGYSTMKMMLAES